MQIYSLSRHFKIYYHLGTSRIINRLKVKSKKKKEEGKKV